jgi:hypothetical protein
LLQQADQWVFLAGDPHQRTANARLEAVFKTPPGGPVDQLDSDQPPQRGVDASQVPEVTAAGLRLDKFWNLSVCGLMGGQGRDAAPRAANELRVTAAGGGDGAQRGVATENAVITARNGLICRPSRQETVGAEVFAQQVEGALYSLFNQPGVVQCLQW